MTTFASMVTMVREECGHAISASQGVNALETIKYMIARTQYELWTAFQFPDLTLRVELPAQTGQFIYAYPDELGYDQIRDVYWLHKNSSVMHTMSFGVPEHCIAAGGGNSSTGPNAELWDVKDEKHFRIWPTPTSEAVIRLKGMKKLLPLVDDDDLVTLDTTLIALMVSAEMLSRAKASDAEIKSQKAQRHLKEILGNKTSAKTRVSTFGAQRQMSFNLMRPGIDYIA